MALFLRVESYRPMSTKLPLVVVKESKSGFCFRSPVLQSERNPEKGSDEDSEGRSTDSTERFDNEEAS